MNELSGSGESVFMCGNFYSSRCMIGIEKTGLLNSRPKGVLAGRPAKSGRKWPKAAESGQN